METYLEPPRAVDDDNFDVEHISFYGYSVDYMFDTAFYFERYGILPNAGGYDDQPARWFDAYNNWCLLRAAVQRDLKDRPKSLTPSGNAPLANWFDDGK